MLYICRLDPQSIGCGARENEPRTFLENLTRPLRFKCFPLDTMLGRVRLSLNRGNIAPPILDN
jgi:hypothetical protein